jgi:hypothetical protein
MQVTKKKGFPAGDPFLYAVRVSIETFIRKDENSGSTGGRARGNSVACSQVGGAGSLTPGKPGYR